MKKTLTINLNGIVFIIDEDAFQSLESYLNEVGKHLSTEEEKEVMGDIEARIAELFTEKLQNNKKIIEITDVENVIEILGHPNEFEDKEEKEESNSDEKKTKSFKRFYRNPDDKKLGGVASGLAMYINKDVTLIRIILLIGAFIPFLSGIIIPGYIIAWLVAPEAITPAQKLEMQGEAVTIDSLKSQYIDNKNFTQPVKNNIDSLFKFIRGFLKVVAVFIGITISFVIAIIIIALLACLFELFFNTGTIHIYGLDIISDLPFMSKIFIATAIIALISIITLPLMGIKLLLNCFKSGCHFRNQRHGSSLFITWLISLLIFAIALALIKNENLQAFGGKQINEIREVEKFNSICIEKGINATIKQGDTYQLTVSSYENFIKNIKSEVRDSILYIEAPYFFNNEAYIVVPDLKRIQVKGTSNVKTNSTLNLKSLYIDAANASNIEMDLEVNELHVNTENVSNAKLNGVSKNIYLSSSDASNIDAENLKSKTAHVQTKNVSKIEVTASDSIWMEASNLSKIKYYSNPVVVEKSSSNISKIEK